MSVPGRRQFLSSLGAGLGATALWPLDGAVTAAARQTTGARPLVANVICGAGAARDHDLDFARRRLLDALYDAGGIHTNVAPDYSRSESIEAGDLLVSYTSMVSPTAEQAQALRRYLERGGRWFALHATNYVPADSPLPDVLGSRFITHPPYGHFAVSVATPGDPLLAGITPFELDDELYVIEHAPDVEVLLQARWGGQALGGRQMPEAVRPLMYRRRVGAGGVLYLALGHNNRPFDKPRADFPDQPDRRGPWDLPVYRELVRRGIDWAAGRRPY